MLSLLSILDVSSNVRLSSGANERCWCVNAMKVARLINSCGCYAACRVHKTRKKEKPRPKNIRCKCGFRCVHVCVCVCSCVNPNWESSYYPCGKTGDDERVTLARTNRNNKEKLVSLIRQAYSLANKLIHPLWGYCL